MEDYTKNLVYIGYGKAIHVSDYVYKLLDEVYDIPKFDHVFALPILTHEKGKILKKIDEIVRLMYIITIKTKTKKKIFYVHHGMYHTLAFYHFLYIYFNIKELETDSKLFINKCKKYNMYIIQ